jgi:hypothetical protein
LSEPPSVELDHRLRDYGLQATGWNESQQAFDAVMQVLPPKLASSLIAFALVTAVLGSSAGHVPATNDSVNRKDLGRLLAPRDDECGTPIGLGRRTDRRVRKSNG